MDPRRIVPASWRMRRRWIAAGLVIVLTAIGVTASEVGVFGPQLSEAARYGSFVETPGDGTVVGGLELAIRNDGRFEAQLTAFDAPELSGVEWRPPDALPTTIDPGDTATVTLEFEVEACQLDARGYDRFDLVGSSGVIDDRSVTVEPARPAEVVERRATPADDGTPRPPWPEQTASWLLEVLEPACTDPAMVADLPSQLTDADTGADTSA